MKRPIWHTPLSSLSRWTAPLLTVALVVPALACGESMERNVEVERLPDPEPNLPSVPRIPPPAHPPRYDDGTYSVYGLRRMMSTTMDQEVEVTGYIVEIYQRPDCDDEENCSTAVAPHIFLADSVGETDADKRILVAGYATRQSEVEDAVRRARRRRRPMEEPGPNDPPPIPTDFAEGNKVRLRGQFQRYSNVGFQSTNGLLEYRFHRTVETAEDGS